MKKAIVIPANPKNDFGDEAGNEGSIIAHAIKIEEEGAVIWRLMMPGNHCNIDFPHQEIRNGYLYDSSERRVTHVCHIAWIKQMSELSFREVRKLCLGELKPGPSYVKRTTYFWILKITGIFALKSVHRLQDFKKFRNGERLASILRTYAIVEDPGYAHHDKHITRGEIISNHMADLLLQGRITEKDIEDLFFYKLMKNCRVIKRQGSFRDAGRLDLLVENRLGNLTIYELKKGLATVAALEQVRRYMDALAKEKSDKAKRITGVILARDSDPELKRALSLPRNSDITFKRYYFRVETD
jgi:hypothetical protein